MISLRLPVLALVVASLSANAAPGGESRFNAFLDARAHRPLRLSPGALQGLGVRVAHEEHRLGLPTVTWTTRAWPASRPGPAAAREHLSTLAPLYRLRAVDVERARQLPLSGGPGGAQVAQFRQEILGAEVFRAQLALVMDRNDALVAATGYLAPSDLVSRAESLPRTVFKISPEQAVAAALRDALGVKVPVASLRAGPEEAGGYRAVHLSAEAEVGTLRGARVRRTWFLLPDVLEPALYVELEPARGRADGTLRSYVLSARTGALLFRNLLVATDSFSYRTWADPATFLPHPGPQGMGASPHPLGTPTPYVPTPVAPDLLTLQSAPFSRNDPWLAPGASVTTGNNADAYADLDGVDGFQSGGADVRATATAPGVFDHVMDVTSLPPGASAGQHMAAVTSLFYTGNFLHDWFYDSGFNEVAGNAQASNVLDGVDRGGLGGDALRLEAQDSSGTNNANMQTPADGAQPRMQMFLWSGSSVGEYLGPATPFSFSVGSAQFGAQLASLEGSLALATDDNGATTGCVAYAPGTFTGKIAFVDRGTCSFITKAANAEAAGALGVLIANNSPGAGTITMTGTGSPVSVPVFSCTTATGQDLKARLQALEPVQLRLTRLLERDGTVDNDIVSHEWAHYLSNRLVGNANGLDNIQGGAMGEGWSDFVALLLKVRNADRLVAGNDRFQGAYPIASWSLGNQDPLAYYYGLRRVPYSTDFSKDPLTFRHVQLGEPAPTGAQLSGWFSWYNPEVHNAGEVWATMLWDAYVGLLELHPFPVARERMKGYLVASLKLTPPSPTFLEARDALWAVAAAADGRDLQAFAAAFARRGAGYGAAGPDRDSMDLVAVRESYESGSLLTAGNALIAESGSGCDADGWLDVGEDGVLTLELRNGGAAPLAPFNAVVVASQATARFSFPSGPRVAVPALPPGASFTAQWPVSLLSASAAASSGLTVSFDEPSLPTAQREMTVNLPVNVDTAPASSAGDGFETPEFAWTCAGSAPSDCTVLQSGSGKAAHLGDAARAGERSLETPPLVVGAGDLTVSWRARWSFEFSYNGGRYDGAVVELAEDGQAWVDASTLGVATGALGYASSVATSAVNPLSGRAAMTFVNPAWPAMEAYSINLGPQFAGKTVRMRFRVGSDEAIGAWGLDVDDVQVGGLLNTPFPAIPDEPPAPACNQRPVARPGGPLSAPESVTDASGRAQLNAIGLDGTASGDPEGAALTWAWSQVAGPPVVLVGADTARPAFTVDVTGDQVVTFQLVVRDGQLASLPAQVQVRVLDGSNHAPLPVASAPASVDERAAPTVTLDGSGSSDPEGDLLTYAWTQVSGPLVVLSGASTATASFTVSEVAADTAYGFELSVGDGLNSAKAGVSVTVRNVDRAPTVSAGPDREVAGRSVALLAATATDPDGDPVSFQWTQVAGPPVALSGADTPAVSFTSPDVKAPVEVRLSATATANGLSASDEVALTVSPDRPPTVSAGADRVVAGRAQVTVAAVLGDPDGDAVQVQWTQVAGPVLALSDADTASVSFTSPDVKTPAEVRLLATATANGLSASDEVVITVSADRAPTVSAGADRAVAGRAQVTVAAVAGDPDGDAVQVQWTQVAGPEVLLSAADTASVSFISPDVKSPADVTLLVTATANGLSATDEVVLTVSPDRRPTVSAGADRAVASRAQVTVAAVAGDPDGDAVQLQWTQVAGPEVLLSGADTASVSFTSPDVKSPADVTLSVTATANGLSATDEVTFSVAADRPPQLSTSPARTVASRGTLALLAQATDPDGDALSFQWTQLSGPAVTLGGADTASASFVAPSVVSPTPIRLQVTASANGLSAGAEVEVTVQAEGTPVADAGPDVTVPGRSTVVLNGTGSVPDGSAVAYSWTQLSGPPVALAGASTAAPSFTGPDVKAPVALTFRLSVSAHGLSAEDTVDVAVMADEPPVAQAGADQDVLVGARVVLVASGSDPEGDALTFAWTQRSGPVIALAGGQSAVASFDVPGDLGSEPVVEWTFEVVATANGLSSAPSQVHVRARRVNRLPVVTGPNRVAADERTLVQLDATAVDPDGDALTWAWEQVGGPTVVLTGQDSPGVSFLVPEVASDLVLAFTVVALDGSGAVGRADVRVEVRNVNRAPVVAITGPAEVQAGEAVVLAAAGASDPDGDALTWSWTQVSGPALAIADAASPVLSFSAPEVDADAEAVFELTVTDGPGASATARHVLWVHPAPAEEKPRSGCGCAAGGVDVPLSWLGWMAAAAWLRRRKGTSWT